MIASACKCKIINQTDNIAKSTQLEIENCSKLDMIYGMLIT